jgi:hypothetical protein
MRFVLFDRLMPDYGIPYSSRQLQRLEAKGLFPRRVPIAPGCSIKGWPSSVIEEHLEKLADLSRNENGDRARAAASKDKDSERNVSYQHSRLRSISN